MTWHGFLLEKSNKHGKIDRYRVQELVAHIDSMNDWLRMEFWPRYVSTIPPNGEWIIGKDKGLECRNGRIWNGGGEDIHSN